MYEHNTRRTKSIGKENLAKNIKSCDSGKRCHLVSVFLYMKSNKNMISNKFK